jgi:hypothetical protein
MPLSYRQNIPPVGLPRKDFTSPIKMPEDFEPKEPRTSCVYGDLWTEESVARLRRAYKENSSIVEIALLFPSRSYKAVKAKIHSLGLFR